MPILDTIQRSSKVVVVLGCLSGLLLTSFLVLRDPFPRLLSGPQDFAGFYMGAKNVGTPHLYDPVVNGYEEALLTGVGKLTTFFQYIRLPFYAVLLRPFAFLTYNRALLLWKTLSVCGLIVAAFLVDPSRKVGALAISWSVGALVMLKWGQDTWVQLLLVCGFFRFLGREKIAFSGICIGCAMTLKPHIFLPFAATLLITKQRLLIFVVAIAGAALAISFAVQGSSWPMGWLDALSLDSLSSEPIAMPAIAGLFGRQLGHAIWLYGAILLATIIAAAWAAKRLPFDLASAVAILLGLLGAPHVYMYDLLIAIPPCLLIARKTKTNSALVMLSPVGQLYFLPPLCSPAAVTAGLTAAVTPLAAAAEEQRVEARCNGRLERRAERH